MKQGTLSYVLHDAANLLLGIRFEHQIVDIPNKGSCLCLVPRNRKRFANIVKERLAERMRNRSADTAIRVEWYDFNKRPPDEIHYLIAWVDDLIKEAGYTPEPRN